MGRPSAPGRRLESSVGRTSGSTGRQTGSYRGHIGATSVRCLGDSRGHWRCIALLAELARSLLTPGHKDT